MGRLVDIEDVKALLLGLDSLPREEEIDDLVKCIPTAYDAEKVVQCIHEYFVQKIDDCEEDIVPHEILEYNKAICEIVRKGGVE